MSKQVIGSSATLKFQVKVLIFVVVVMELKVTWLFMLFCNVQCAGWVCVCNFCFVKWGSFLHRLGCVCRVVKVTVINFSSLPVLEKVENPCVAL